MPMPLHVDSIPPTGMPTMSERATEGRESDAQDILNEIQRQREHDAPDVLGGETESRRVELPVSDRQYATIPSEVRREYLTDADKFGTCYQQAVGPEVWLWIPSEATDVRIRIPLDDWQAGKVFERSITRWRVTIRRFLNGGRDSVPAFVECAPEDPRAFEGVV